MSLTSMWGIVHTLVFASTLWRSLAVSVNADATSRMTLQAMEKVFTRSDHSHKASMVAISRGLSLHKALEFMHKMNLTKPALVQVTSEIRKRHLRKAHQLQPQGYSGIDGARKLLNDMIYESMSKYDEEIAKCTEYYSKQCAAMEVCRGQIAGSNYIAANSRSLILDAQGTTSRCEVDIPTRKLELKQHLLKCKHELAKMNARLKIILGDIAVMTTILEMTDCDKALVQVEKLALMKCKDPCKKTSFITFSHSALKDKVSKLSLLSHGIMQETFEDLFSGIESLQSTEAVRVDRQVPYVNKTQFNNPPTPRTEVPADPCTDPDAGAPSVKDKRAAKCSITKSPQCYKLQERFLLIQAGIEDERDELQEEIAMLEQYSEEGKKTLETQINNDEGMLANAQTKLAQATEKEADAAEEARQTASENEQLNGDLRKQMKTCSANYINFETEICALKKIRGELYKLRGSGSAFFQDCEVGKWNPEECTRSCDGGEQKLTRSVMTHPDGADGGAKCLPLVAMRTCNNQPCPVDCNLDTWTGWSKCSAQCGGGVMQRLREVKVAAKYGGRPCGSTSETRACNNEACEKDCRLSDWTEWSQCSKLCDGGTQRRQKYIKESAEGQGYCPGEWSPKRLEYKECALRRCKVLAASAPMACDTTLDVILLIDGSGSLGRAGWNAEIKAAKSFIGAFKAAKKIQMAVILFSGPKTWSGVYKCVGHDVAPTSLQSCGIKQVTHFTDDLDKVDNLVTGLDWPQGSTLTSLALLTAKSEMTLGRGDIHTVVVVFTDGRPLSYRKTTEASHAVRKRARLVWVPITRYAPLKQIKAWATRRWQENVVVVKDFAALEKPELVTHIVADICPN